MTIAVILQTKGDPVETLSPDATVADAIALLADKRIGAAPVLDGATVIGVFSERDVIAGLRERGAAALAMRVRDAMTAPVATVGPTEPVLAALSLMTQRRIRHLPVLAAGRMIGFVSIGDLVKHRIDGIESDAAAMRAYIQSA